MAELSPAFTVSSNYSFGGPYTGASASGGAGMRDGNSAAANTVWAGDDVNDWIRADLTSAKMVEKIGVAPINSSFDGWGPSYLDGAKIQSASSSGGPWTDRATLSGHADGVTKEYAIGVSARYWRLSATGFQLGVGEFRIYELDPGVSVAAPLPSLTVSSPAGFVATGAGVAGSLPAFMVSASTATVETGVVAGGTLPALTFSPLAAIVAISASVSATLSVLSVSAPAGAATSVTNATSALPNFTMSAPAGSAKGGATAAGANSSMLMNAPAAAVSAGALVAGALPSLLVSAPIASASGGAAIACVFAALSVTAPTGAAEMIVRVESPPGRRLRFDTAQRAGRTIRFDTASRAGRTLRL